MSKAFPATPDLAPSKVVGTRTKLHYDRVDDSGCHGKSEQSILRYTTSISNWVYPDFLSVPFLDNLFSTLELQCVLHERRRQKVKELAIAKKLFDTKSLDTTPSQNALKAPATISVCNFMS